MKWHKQGTKEFGAAGAPPAQPGGDSGAAPAHGQELSQFYASLVETSGQGWALGEVHPGLGAGVLDQQPHEQVAQGTIIVPPAQHYAAGPPTEAEAAAAAPARIAIPTDNVGYRLLEKAGWTAGRGIGAREQGEQEPLQPERQEGGLGLGYAPKPAKKATQSPAAAASTHQQGKHPQQTGPARPLPPDELEQQSVEQKVRRVRQVMQAEADEQAGKVIAQYVYRAFGPDDEGTVLNPVLRKTKLSATNPLL